MSTTTIMRMHRAALMVLLAAVASGCAAGGDDGWPYTTHSVLIEDAGATNPTVAMASDGRVYVAYTSRTGGGADAYIMDAYIIMHDGNVDEDWDGNEYAGKPVRVNHVPGEVAIHNQAPAQVAVGPDGTIYVAWVRQTTVEGRRFPASEVRLARSLDGGATFDDAITVSEEVGFPTSRHFHDIAIGPDGTVYLSWLDGEARDRAAAGSTSAGTSAAHDAAHSHEHAHDVPEDGLPGTQLKVARSLDRGATFEPAVVVADNSCQCCRTALTVGADGEVYVAWRHIFGANTRDMAVALSSDGGRTFSEPVRVHDDGWHIEACPHSGPSLHIDDEARLHIAWYTGAEGREGLFYAYSGDHGRSFTAATPVRRGLPVTQARLAQNGRRMIAAYDDPRRAEVALVDLGGGDDSISERYVASGSAAALDAIDGYAALAWKVEEGIRLRMFGPVR